MNELFKEDSLLQVSPNIMITKEAFIDKFGERHNYETLMKHKNANDKWRKRFGYMKKKGILN